MLKIPRPVLALVLVLATTCSHAQFGGGMGGGGMGGGGKGRGQRGGGSGDEAAAVVQPQSPAEAAARLRERLLDLRLLLRITPEQGPAWTGFSNAVWNLAGHPSVRPAPEPDGRASALEVFRLKADQAEENARRLREFSQAADRLYAAMTPEQRLTADAQFVGAMP
ncbi:hypothetical protein GT347_09160 [Xylophilus rhododendri]|uniref:LTXXQ motif family protein n=1 Tax=Xylophilus rhododendri TaxID=2697032 RepID=A0A857J534_9BURK|nr:Spy/CpxP family protein refolding chaperone [Xylophilus rhododendri]QHI98142.1 hypothetical protein GT347_09160 [Xylophilus rhododendri]